MPSELKKKIISGFFWQGIERVGVSGLSFIISLILARLLAPKQFGIIAILNIFIGIFDIFIDSGFGTALIQKKDADDLDCCTIFYFNLLIAITAYIIIFISAPYISIFYGEENLTIYFRVMSLALIIRAFGIVPRTLLTKNMLFKTILRVSWLSLVLSGTVGVVMAYCGCHIWSLIVQHHVYAFVGSFVVWQCVNWRPRLKFSLGRLRQMFYFGGKVLGTSILGQISSDLYSLVIGKCYRLETLAFYNRGIHIPRFAMALISNTISGVMFPAFSSIQDDTASLRKYFSKTFIGTMFFIVPAMFMLAVLSRQIIILLFTDKWLASSVFMQMMCILLIFVPMQNLNEMLLTACGRSGAVLVIEVLRKIQMFIGVFIAYKFGVLAMMFSQLVLAPVEFIEIAWLSRKLINYSFVRQFCDILPIIFVALISAAAEYYSVFLIGHLNIAVQIIVGGAVFSVSYLGIMILTKRIPGELYQLCAKIKLRKGEAD